MTGSRNLQHYKHRNGQLHQLSHHAATTQVSQRKSATLHYSLTFPGSSKCGFKTDFKGHAIKSASKSPYINIFKMTNDSTLVLAN